MDPNSLVRDVEDAFVRTAHGLERWDDPHPPPDRIVAEEEYSRVTNPARWRIIGARVDAWLDVLVARGLASVERDATVAWEDRHATNVTRTDLVTPAVPGGLRLVVGRTSIESVGDAGVWLGVGDPAVCVGRFPDCGCDACDSGSQDAIDEIDSFLRPVVTGEFRFLRRGEQSIMVTDDGCRHGRNIRLRDGVDDILADPIGWIEWSGPPWSGR